MRILLAAGESLLEHTVRQTLRRFNYEWASVQDGADAFQKLLTDGFDLAILAYDLKQMNTIEILKRVRSVQNTKIVPILVLVRGEKERIDVENGHFSSVTVLSVPFSPRRFVDVVHQSMQHGTKITCLGGGTGLYTLLSGLKTLSNTRLTSIVSMSDDGGSTGRLIDQFGVLPPGDIRRSLVALSTAPDLLNELIQYRFQKGEGLEGHNIGNLLLTALFEMHGSMTYAIDILSELLDIQGKVVPVTDSKHRLKAQLEDGSVIEGEHRIDLFEGYNPNLRIEKVWLDPAAKPNPNAIEAILNADWILLGPGDLFTSIIPNLLVDGVSEAIRASRAKKMYLCNLMTEIGETTRFQISDHVTQIIRYLKKDVLDYVLCSTTKFSSEAIRAYLAKGQILVREDVPASLGELTKAHFVWADVASERVLVRHDSLKLAKEIEKIIHPKNKK